MLHLIVNPTAGRGRALAHLDTVVTALERGGARVERHTTASPTEVDALVAALAPDDTAVAVGGDGTVHGVARACLAHDRRLGVLPFGSGDDFAHALGLRRDRHAQALQALLHGVERRIDVGTVDGVPFVNGFGTGFDADVARRVHDAPPLYRGLGRYLYGVATAMRDFRLADLDLGLTAPDGSTTRWHGPALLVAVQNGPRTGGSFRFAPGASHDDGVLDVVVAGAFGRAGTLAILPRVMRGRHLGHAKVHRFAAVAATVRWSTPVAAHAEGELLRPATAYDVGLRPRALRVLAPA